MLKSKLKKDNIELETVEFEEDFEFFKKHQIKGVPKLLVFENSDVVEIIQGIDDIIKIVDTKMHAMTRENTLDSLKEIIHNMKPYSSDVVKLCEAAIKIIEKFEAK
jgi:hypothetical protein